MSSLPAEIDALAMVDHTLIYISLFAICHGEIQIVVGVTSQIGGFHQCDERIGVISFITEYYAKIVKSLHFVAVALAAEKVYC